MKNLYKFIQNMVTSKDETETTSFVQEDYYATLLMENHDYSERAAKEIAKVCRHQREAEIEEKLEDLFEDIAELILEKKGIISGELSEKIEDDEALYDEAEKITSSTLDSIEEVLTEMISNQL